MKKLIATGLLFIISQVSANTYIQLGAGGVTPHFGSEKRDYCNQWNNTGVIFNRSQYIRFMSGGIGFTYMQGHDSICSVVEGLLFHYNLKSTDFFELGMTFGGYAYSQDSWDAYALSVPIETAAPEPTHFKYFGRDMVPVLALDLGIHLIKGENWSLKLNNLFTPIIFNHSIAWEYRFGSGG